MSEQLDILLQIGVLLGRLLYPLLMWIVNWLPLLLWVAWWLWAADWKKIWPILGQGAWAPAVLLIIAAAMGWSQIAPSYCDCLGVRVPNFWWQLGACGLLAAIALFCGWVQGLLGWEPPEISFEPPAEVAHEHGH